MAEMRNGQRVNWRKPAIAPAPAPSVLCHYYGDPLTGAERNARGLAHAPDWRHCLNPDLPLKRSERTGDAVCRCDGCGPACPGWKEGDKI